MNLLIINNFIIEAFENKCQVDVIFTNFSKAPDRADHNTHLQVLRKSGFGDPLSSCLNYYLFGRRQAPQGAIFPLYFLLYLLTVLKK